LGIHSGWNSLPLYRVASVQGEEKMAKAATKSTRGRNQDRVRVAGGQDYEVRYTAKKSNRSAAAVKKAVKKIGTSRKKVERRIGR
jgi:hypothetical protein